MTVANEHTGKFMRTRAATKEYRDNFDQINWNSSAKDCAISTELSNEFGKELAKRIKEMSFAEDCFEKKEKENEQA